MVFIEHWCTGLRFSSINMFHGLIVLSCLAIFTSSYNRAEEKLDASNNTRVFTATSNSDESTNRLILPGASFVQDIQNDMIGYWKDFMNWRIKTPELVTLAQTEHEQYLKRIKQLNHTLFGKRICQLMNSCRNSIMSAEVSSSLKKDESKFDEIESTVANERQGEVSEENSSSEDDILSGEHEERQEPRQEPLSPLIGPSISIGTFSILFPVLLAEIVMTLIVLGFNISVVSDAPRLGDLHQQQLNALATIVGVPQEIVNPVDEDPARDGLEESDENISENGNNVHRQGTLSFFPTTVWSLREKLNGLVHDYENPSVSKILLGLSSWVVIYFILQSVTGSLSPGLSFLVLSAIAYVYYNYYRTQGTKPILNHVYSRSFELNNTKFEEVANFVQNALTRFPYLDNNLS